MPLNAKQSTRENKIGIAFESVCPFGPSTPARPSPRVFAVRASQLVVHQLETFLAEAPVGNWCLQTDRLDLRPPMALHSRHLSLQPLPTRGLADTSAGQRRQLENGNLGCLRTVQTTPLPVQKMRQELRWTATGSSPGGVDDQPSDNETLSASVHGGRGGL